MTTKKKGTHLATIHSSFDNSQAKEACGRVGQEGEDNECWIGLKGPFRHWADGVFMEGPGKFNNWASKQTGLEANRWRLILRQKDASKAWFHSGFINSGIENPSDIEADTYSIIGELKPDAYKDNDGKYKFKLEFTRQDNGNIVTLVWRQSTWLTSGKIEGFEGIDIPQQTYPHWCTKFEGLGRSDCTYCTYLDGNGNTKGCWWNAVGTMRIYHGGLPGFDAKVAKAAALYIWSPGRSTICGNLHTNDGKWYDILCARKKHFVCNAMSFSERMDMHMRKGLEYATFNRHKAEWVNQKQLDHMKEMEENEQKRFDEMMNDPNYWKQQMENEKKKMLEQEDHEKLREQLRGNGYFDQYGKQGMFDESNLNQRYGTDMRYSFPVQWQRRRMMEGDKVEYMKCVWVNGDDGVYEICVGLDGVDVWRYLNGTVNGDMGYREVRRLEMDYWIESGERHCWRKYLCLLVMEDREVVVEMVGMEIGELRMSLLNNDEWDDIGIELDDEMVKYRCVYLLEMKVCVELMYDKMKDVYLYRASVTM